MIGWYIMGSNFIGSAILDKQFSDTTKSVIVTIIVACHYNFHITVLPFRRYIHELKNNISCQCQ